MKSGLNSQVFNKFVQIAGGLKNSEVENWKIQGGKVAGYFCPVIPEELMIVAGLLPFRIRGAGSKATDRADVFFGDINCSFPRHCFNQALLGEFDWLDGVITNTICDTLMRVTKNWRHAGLKTPFLYILDNALASNDQCAAHFLDQLKKLKGALEKQFNVTITDQKLWEAIRLCNETKRLQQQLYALRKAPHPPITGAETVAVMVAGVSMPKEEYNRDLKTLLNELNTVKSTAKYAARLMVVGSGYDDTLLCDIIEDLGGVVVTDQTCFGSRTMVKTIAETGGDPLDAIARYHVLEVPYCPKIIGTYPQRKELLLALAKDYKVDGIVGQCFASCDMWAAELYLLKADLREAGVPFIWFEREYVPDLVGQLKTRIQAFMETMGA